MSHFSAGLVMTGGDGYVHVRIWGASSSAQSTEEKQRSDASGTGVSPWRRT